MNRLRLLAIGSVLLLSLGALAQQTPTSPDVRNAAVTPVEQHLKMLSEKLGLTAEQQAKARPILQQMHDGSQKLEDDPALTTEQRQAAMHPIFLKADQQLREILTDNQKRTLDDLEAQMHGEHHGRQDGSPSAPQS